MLEPCSPNHKLCTDGALSKFEVSLKPQEKQHHNLYTGSPWKRHDEDMGIYKVEVYSNSNPSAGVDLLNSPESNMLWYGAKKNQDEDLCFFHN